MKRILSILAVALIATTAMPTDANAQLNKILKKAKEILTTPSSNTSTKPSASESSSSSELKGNTVLLANGVKLTNPCPQILNIEYVGCYGNSNANTVKVVIKITAKDLNYLKAGFGISTQAYDTDGNFYEADAMANKNVKLIADVPAKFELYELEKVPKRVTKLSVVSCGWYLDLEHSSTSSSDTNKIYLKNVPIQWDVK